MDKEADSPKDIYRFIPLRSTGIASKGRMERFFASCTIGDQVEHGNRHTIESDTLVEESNLQDSLILPTLETLSNFFPLTLSSELDERAVKEKSNVALKNMPAFREDKPLDKPTARTFHVPSQKPAVSLENGHAFIEKTNIKQIGPNRNKSTGLKEKELKDNSSHSVSLIAKLPETPQVQKLTVSVNPLQEAAQAWAMAAMDSDPELPAEERPQLNLHFRTPESEATDDGKPFVFRSLEVSHSQRKKQRKKKKNDNRQALNPGKPQGVFRKPSEPFTDVKKFLDVSKFSGSGFSQGSGMIKKLPPVPQGLGSGHGNERSSGQVLNGTVRGSEVQMKMERVQETVQKTVSNGEKTVQEKVSERTNRGRTEVVRDSGGNKGEAERQGSGPQKRKTPDSETPQEKGKGRKNRGGGKKRDRKSTPFPKKDRSATKFVPQCKYWQESKCSKGSACEFSHSGPPKTHSELCKFAITDSCLRGQDCPYSHNFGTFPCKFHHLNAQELGFACGGPLESSKPQGSGPPGGAKAPPFGCREGSGCRYSHEPITEEEREKLLRRVYQEREVGETAGGTPLAGGGGKVSHFPGLGVASGGVVFPLLGRPANQTAPSGAFGGGNSGVALWEDDKWQGSGLRAGEEALFPGADFVFDVGESGQVSGLGSYLEGSQGTLSKEKTAGAFGLVSEYGGSFREDSPGLDSHQHSFQYGRDTSQDWSGMPAGNLGSADISMFGEIHPNLDSFSASPVAAEENSELSLLLGTTQNPKKGLEGSGSASVSDLLSRVFSEN